MPTFIASLIDDHRQLQDDAPQSIRQAIIDGEHTASLASLAQGLPSVAEIATEALLDTDLDRPSGAPPVSLWIACATASSQSALDDQIDAWLDDPSRRTRTVHALAAAGLDWDHPGIDTAFSDGTDRFAAASLLARNAPERFHDRIADFDSPEAIVDALRAASLSGATDLGPTLLEWREELVDDLNERHLHHLDAALACADPNLYARHLLNGNVTSNWLADDRGVADFLSLHGLNDWLGPLAWCRHVRDRQAFFLSATFAVTAAFTQPFDDLDLNDDDLDPALASQWISERPDRVALCLALSDGDDLAVLLVENALHHALLQRDLLPPAITGLPLSGPLPDPSQLDDTFALFDDQSSDIPQHRVALLRTLSDLLGATWHNHLDPELAPPWLHHFANHCDATDAMARISLNPDRRVPGRPNDWGCRGLYRTQWTLTQPLADALDALAQRWWHGPISRADLHRQAALSLLE